MFVKSMSSFSCLLLLLEVTWHALFVDNGGGGGGGEGVVESVFPNFEGEDELVMVETWNEMRIRARGGGGKE
jgi:hypothetical protein